MRSSLQQEDVMLRELSSTEVALGAPEDVEAACDFCKERNAAEAVFFIEGHPPVGRCDCTDPPQGFVERMRDIVRAQPNVHVRVGECLT